jgi:cytochrome P450
MNVQPKIVFSKEKKVIPPKIQGWPLIGTVPHFYRQQLDFLLEARATYGDVFRLQLGETEITVLAHPRHAQHVLIDNARNYRNKGGSGFRIAPLPLMRSGLATTIQPQASWRQQRRGVQPYFHHKRLGALTDLMVEAISESLAEWDAVVGSGQAVDMEQEVTRITINVVGKSIFGIHIAPEEAERIAAEVRVVMDYLWLGTIENVMPSWIPLPGKHRYQQAVKAVDEYVEALIERSLQPSGMSNNLMLILAELVEEGYMSRDQLHNEAVTMLIAGYESSAANLSWAFHLLTQYPAIQKRLQAEVFAVLGTRKPAFTDIPALSYPRMVIQEALRLYAPSYWTQRMALETDQIDGFHIPAGAIVVPMIHLVHLHPDVWENPERFDPERFLPERTENRHKLAWLPFGAGQRMCMAIEFALIKGQLILSQIFQRYELSAVPGKTPKMVMASNIRPKGGVWVNVDTLARG